MTNDKNTLLEAALVAINGKLEENLKEYKGKNSVADSLLNYLKTIEDEGGISFINYVSPQMMLQLLKPKDKALKKILSEHHLLTIYTVYDIMQVNFTLEPKYDEVFLLSSESRRAILTSGCLIQKPGKKGKTVWNPLTREWSKKKGFLEDFLKGFSEDNCNDWYKYIKITVENTKDGSTIVTEKNIEQILSENLIWWGSQLALPKKTKIILSFNQLYPSMYLGSNETRKKDLGQDEFLLEEQPWSVHAIYDKDLNVTKNNKVTVNNKKMKLVGKDISDLGISKQKMPNNEQLLNLSSVGNSSKSSKNFKKIELNIQPKDEDYDLIVTLPYQPVKADMLVSVKINDNQNGDTEEVVLSTT